MISYKFRIYPNKEQANQIDSHFGCVRFVYNWGLATKIAQYQQTKENLSCFDLMKMLPELKENNKWLKDVNSQSLQMALRNLDNAYNKFFKEKNGFPKFHSKHGKQSFQCPQRCKIENGMLFMPKIKGIKIVQHREIIGKQGTFAISKTKTMKYFVSITTDNTPIKKNIPNKTIGIDLGIKTYATYSDGTKISNPKWFKNKQKRLEILQRRASKKKKGSRNRAKANLLVAKCHEKISNQRNDWQHKATYKLVSENQVICLETLNVAGMLKNHKLAKAIQECAWSQFNEFLEYKANWYGAELVRIGRFEPSSKMCSCGEINHNLSLSDREWTCAYCGTNHDRDVLAAQNILRFAIKQISGRVPSTEPVELSSIDEVMKQEARHCGAVHEFCMSRQAEGI